MAMKETEGSLRAYFLIAGGLSTLSAVGDIKTATEVGTSFLPMSWRIAIWFPILASLALGLGFVAAGVKLKSALPTGATWIKQLLLGALLVLGADVILVGSILGTDIGQSRIITSVIGLLITVYLLASVRRLANEAMAKQPPIARVV
jgi:hypothetical protein